MGARRHRVTRGLRAGAVLACGLLLAACGSAGGGGGSGSPSPPRAPSSAASSPASAPSGAPSSSPPGPGVTQTGGVVQGRVLRPPGGDPRSGGGGGTCPGAAVVPVNGDPVEARDQHGQVAARAVTSADGRFAFTLPPGGYRVVEGILGVGQLVEVRSGLTVPVTLAIGSVC